MILRLVRLIKQHSEGLSPLPCSLAAVFSQICMKGGERMFEVTIKHDNNVLRFHFSEICDAVKFIQDCIETAEYVGTTITLEEKE